MLPRRTFLISGFLFLLFGLIFLSNALQNITGLSIFENYSLGLSSFWSVWFFICGAILLYIGSRSLESLVSDIKQRKENRDKFVENNLAAYKQHLEKTNQIPSEIKSENEKWDYARRKLAEQFEPLVDYTNKNAVEYIEFFGSSPERNSVDLPGNESKKIPVKINYLINDKRLKSLTEKYSSDSELWRGANNQIYRLSSGEGVDMKIVPETGGRYVYLRDIHSGARVFLKKLSDSEYDLVAITSGQQKKRDEEKVFSIIKEIDEREQARKNKK